MTGAGVTVGRMSPVLTSPVVSPQWLADHLGTDHLSVVDATVVLSDSAREGASALATGARLGREGFERDGHVPGAVFADLVDDFSDSTAPLPFTRPTSDRFEAAVAELGISNDSTVVVYDSADGRWAARLWWLFRAHGHDAVAVLDGGWSSWVEHDKPYELGGSCPSPDRSHDRFVAAERLDRWADKAFVEAVVAGDEDALLICGSASAEFEGAPGVPARPGHIPGSISVPAESLTTATGRLAVEADLRTTLAPALTGPRPVVYCTTGVSASVDALALVALGRDDVAVYDGSLTEWAADPEAPLVTEAA